ncbi:Lar family restriction alleviation protein [Candidatus Saccharibacteria bacterium]|nr:Lar family restriction alleviation protein [Candidatus Saccharibacteria bacterium]
MIILEPCPKCGGKAKLRRGLPNLGNSKERFAMVQCLTCNYKTPTIKPKGGESNESLKNRVIELWNQEPR